MIAIPTTISDLLIIEPKVFGDECGGFFESFSRHQFAELTAEFLYKTTDYWAPKFERSIAWNDPAIGIRWPIQGEPTLSAKDHQAEPLAEAEHFA